MLPGNNFANVRKVLRYFYCIFVVAKQFAIFSIHVVVTINTITVELSLEKEFLENVNGNKINMSKIIWKKYLVEKY